MAIFDHFIVDHFHHLGSFGTILTILSIFNIFFFKFSHSELFSGRFDTSGSMLPRLVSKISPLYAFCDVVVVVVGVVVVVVGIGDF